MLQSGTGAQNQLRGFRCAHLVNTQGIIMQAGNGLRNQRCDFQTGAAAQLLRKIADGFCGCGDMNFTGSVFSASGKEKKGQEKNKQLVFH